MNHKILFLFSLCMLLTAKSYSQEQEPKNIFGFGAGFSPAKQAYVDTPPYIWIDLNSSPVFQGFYARQLNSAFRLGSYFEYQSAKFTYADIKATRYNVGVNWLCQYPETKLHSQLGGYFGYGTLKAEGWDQSLGGIDYGIMIGPAYETGHFGVALHFQVGFGYYTSSGDPDEVDFSIPRYLLKVYYKL